MTGIVIGGVVLILVVGLTGFFTLHWLYGTSDPAHMPSVLREKDNEAAQESRNSDPS
jgi:hypothetical protein